jgi:hypothetical protein
MQTPNSLYRPGLPQRPAHSLTFPSGGRRAFELFNRPVSPDPPPTKWAFYWENIKDNAVNSYMQGSTRYYEWMGDHPVKAAGVVGLAIGLAGLMTILNRHSWLLTSAYMLGALTYPVNQAITLLPKMEDAYETVLAGDPKLGEQQFKSALDETVYKIAHKFFKPLSFALMLVALLRVPHNIQMIRENKGWMSVFKPLVEHLDLTPTSGFLEPIHRVHNHLSTLGDRMMARIPIIGRFFRSSKPV